MEQLEKDKYYLKLAKQVGERSQCLSRKIGSVLVKDDRVIATGVNGPASGVPHCGYRNDKGIYQSFESSDKCPRKRMGYKQGEGLQHCSAVHSEVNTVLQSARLGVNTKGSTLYCYCNVPCINCSKELINAGIQRVVCLGKEEYFNNNGLSSIEMLTQAGVQLDIINMEEDKDGKEKGANRRRN